MQKDTLKLWFRLCTKRASGAAMTAKEIEQLENCEKALNRDERAFDEAAERASNGYRLRHHDLPIARNIHD